MITFMQAENLTNNGRPFTDLAELNIFFVLFISFLAVFCRSVTFYLFVLAAFRLMAMAQPSGSSPTFSLLFRGLFSMVWGRRNMKWMDGARTVLFICQIGGDDRRALFVDYEQIWKLLELISKRIFY